MDIQGVEKHNYASAQQQFVFQKLVLLFILTQKVTSVLTDLQRFSRQNVGLVWGIKLVIVF